jgi:hypothetical protein
MRLVAKGGLAILHREARVGIALADHAFLERRRFTGAAMIVASMPRVQDALLAELGNHVQIRFS